MLVNLRHKGKAITHANSGWSISFEELEGLVDLATQDLETNAAPRSALTLTMTKTARTIAYFLASLKTNRPLAILSSDWTGAESLKRRAMLGSSTSLDQSDWPPASLETSTKNSPHPSSSASIIHTQTQLILFTSGSTGTPKAVELSRANIESNTTAVIESLKFDKVLTQHLFLDLSYSFGLLGQLIPALQLGVETKLYDMVMDLRGPAAEQTLEGMISGVPSQLRLLAEFSELTNEGVTDLVSAGAYLPVDLRERLREKFPNARITSNYGQTEASPRILSIGSEDKEFWMGVVGRTVHGFSHRISASGELEVSGPQVMLGYLGDPQASAEKVVDGYLRTGDLAVADAKGNVAIQGRNDDQIKIAGERMNPIEVETSIQEILGIPECLVYAYVATSPAGITSEPALALVLPSLTNLSTSVELRKTLAAKLSKQKIPRLIFLADSLPVTANGKRQRRNLDPQALNWKRI